MFGKLNLLATYRKRKALNQLKAAAIEVNSTFTDEMLSKAHCFTCAKLSYSKFLDKVHAKTYIAILYMLRNKYIQYANTKYVTDVREDHAYFITKLVDATPLSYAELRREWLQFIIDYKE